MEVLGFSEFSQNLSPQGGDTEREKERWALRVRPRNSREGRSAQVYATSFLEKKKILHDGRPGVPHCLHGATVAIGSLSRAQIFFKIYIYTFHVSLSVKY